MSVKMMKEPQRDRMLQAMLRAVADSSRLTMLRMMNQREFSVGELAVTVELTEPTVSHHLTKLREAGLVSLRMDGTTRYYRLNRGGLRRFKEWFATLEEMPVVEEIPESDNTWIEVLDWPATEKQVLRDHTYNGLIVYLPAKRKPQLVILRWVGSLFERDHDYTEPQVNEVLKTVYETDYVWLRRELVEAGHLAREKNGSRYWVPTASA